MPYDDAGDMRYFGEDFNFTNRELGTNTPVIGEAKSDQRQVKFIQDPGKETQHNLQSTYIVDKDKSRSLQASMVIEDKKTL